MTQFLPLPVPQLVEDPPSGGAWAQDLGSSCFLSCFSILLSPLHSVGKLSQFRFFCASFKSRVNIDNL